jgi:endonuclease YncB( thermonuclease family)
MFSSDRLIAGSGALQTRAMTPQQLRPSLPALSGALLGLLTSWPPAVVSADLQATVLSVGDGDTIRVRQSGRTLTVRLACIDAPETAQSPWGQQARQALQQQLALGRAVRLAVQTTDRYGRVVAEVFTGVNVNLALVEAGQAFAYRQYLSGCDRDAYLNAEVRASRRRLGIWQVQGGIMRPWEFRRGRRTASIPDGTTPGGRRYRCSEIGSYERAQQLLRQGHVYLDGDRDGEACESLR